MNERVKKSLEKSKKVLEENCRAKNLQKRYTFTIIAMNFIQEQLKINVIMPHVTKIITSI